MPCFRLRLEEPRSKLPSRSLRKKTVRTLTARRRKLPPCKSDDKAASSIFERSDVPPSVCTTHGSNEGFSASRQSSRSYGWPPKAAPHPVRKHMLLLVPCGQSCKTHDRHLPVDGDAGLRWTAGGSANSGRPPITQTAAWPSR